MAFIFGDKEFKKTVGGKSFFAGNAGFSISGSKSLAHPLISKTSVMAPFCSAKKRCEGTVL
jgi:hypothetical protein